MFNGRYVFYSETFKLQLSSINLHNFSSSLFRSLETCPSRSCYLCFLFPPSCNTFIFFGAILACIFLIRSSFEILLLFAPPQVSFHFFFHYKYQTNRFIFNHFLINIYLPLTCLSLQVNNYIFIAFFN